MKIIESGIKECLIISPDIKGDSRGYFFESFNAERFHQETGLDINFVQDNESRSHYGVLRGLHFQRPPHAQSKLVRCVSGKVLDVAVDLRKGSPTYGKYASCLLTGENHLQFFVPKGFAHGFAVLSDEALFQYKCDDFYHPECEGAIMWDDPDVGIDWPLAPSDVELSAKDHCHPYLKDFDSPFHI